MINITEPIRILHLSLPLTRPSADRDDANVSALWYAKGWFTHVAILTRSPQETPDAIRHPDVLRAVAICGIQGLKVIWGRRLWVSWPSDELEAPMPTKWSYRYASYYAAAIARVQAEALAIGAVGTMLDAEPYGDSVQKEILKSEPELLERPRILSAIGDAVSVTGQVDFITPTSSMNPNAYPWSMAGLGKWRMDQKTYKVKTADGHVNANPPDGDEHKVHVWGHWVGENALSVAEVKAFDMDRVRERYLECIGQWLYADKLAETLKGWNG